ncbi:MAG: nitroreductase family protein [Spirochaetales bacterium]|nr:nitroreductase family protein [Spirochaetales bacterium]
MHINGINNERCTGCMECVKECPQKLFSMKAEIHKKKEIIFNDPYSLCIGCGHCVSVCSYNAILFESEAKTLLFDGVQDLSQIISFNDMVSFLQGKRSVRRFRKMPLPKEEIDAVLSVMQYAPSASNARRWEYVVITNSQKRKQLTDAIVEIIKKMKLLFRLKWLVYPFLPKDFRTLIKNPGTEVYMSDFYADYKKGKDRLFFHAPCIIILHSPSYSHMAGNDAGIALTYGMLAAGARGLGTCWIGFAQEAFYLQKSLKKQLGIPDNHQVYGVMVMGYPDVTYYKVPPRDLLKMQKIDE